MIGTSRQLLLMVVFMASTCDAMSRSASLWGNVKQDCSVSIWSQWRLQRGGVIRTRTRTVYSQPLNGGAKCPVLSETEINPWNPKRSAAQIADGITRALVSSRFVTDVQITRFRPVRQTPTVLPRDILFIVDMSGSIGRAVFEEALHNVAKLVEKICGDVGQGVQQNRVAVISFSSTPVINFFFKDHMTLQQVKNAIMSIPYLGGGTCLNKALQKAVDVFKTNKGMRSDPFSVKEVVILTDGRWNCGADDHTIYNLVASLSAALGNNLRPIAIYAFVIKLQPSPVVRQKFDQLVTSPVQNHLFVFVNELQFTTVVNLILTYPGNCAPIIIGRK